MQINQIYLESSLQVYFFEMLQSFNVKMLRPLPKETIFYSSLVMDHYNDVNKFFEIVDGKSKDKVLGIKLLESEQLSKEKKKLALKDIAETSLLLCGYFSDSLNRKMVDAKYYQDLGTIAYQKLNSLEPRAYNITEFYKNISFSFGDIINLMTLTAQNSVGDKDSPWLICNKKVS